MLAAVDLRSDIDAVYSQSSSNACTAHALVAALDVLHDRAGQSKRFSRAWVYWWSRFKNGRPGQNVGINADDFVWALQTKGAVLESQWPWANADMPPPHIESQTGQITVLPTHASVDNIRRKLCLGVPVIACIDINSHFYALAGAKDWRKHDWDTSGLTLYGHAVCVVGYDDAAGRLLVENSFGSGWGDGGFFGIPYETFKRVQLGCWTVDRIEGVANKPVEGYVSIPYLLGPQDTGFFATKNRDQLVQMFTEAIGAGGVHAVLDLCRKWHVTDKHLENLFRWDRGTVRAFQEANPALDWAGFPWAEL